MPPVLAGWASTLDLTGLDDDLALAVRHFLARGYGLAEPERSRLGRALAIEVAAATTPPPPPGVPGWAYLAAVLAERHQRSARRLMRARAVTARLWPELAAQSHPAYRLGHWPVPERDDQAGHRSASSFGGRVPDAAPPAGPAVGAWPGSPAWPTPPWLAGREADWTGFRRPPVASTLRPSTPDGRSD